MAGMMGLKDDCKHENPRGLDLLYPLSCHNLRPKLLEGNQRDFWHLMVFALLSLVLSAPPLL